MCGRDRTHGPGDHFQTLVSVVNPEHKHASLGSRCPLLSVQVLAVLLHLIQYQGVHSGFRPALVPGVQGHLQKALTEKTHSALG